MIKSIDVLDCSIEYNVETILIESCVKKKCLRALSRLYRNEESSFKMIEAKAPKSSSSAKEDCCFALLFRVLYILPNYLT